MDNPSTSNYWFKRRRYGFGWIPTTWQGWLSIILYLIIVSGAGYYFDQQTTNSTPESPSLYIFLSILLFASLILIAISFFKGPRPKWRWGQQPTDNPEEDY